VATKFARDIARAAKPVMGWGGMRLIRVAPAARGATLTAGTTTTTTPYRCRGRRVSAGNTSKEPTVTQTRTRVVTFAVLGATLPDGIEPRLNDRIEWDGAMYLIEADAVNDDGLGAVWTCPCRPLTGG
jgi:hypothetical protein